MDCHVTGYWLPKASVDPGPTGDISRFLEEPAIAVGFGSSISPDPAFLRSVRAAIRLAGHRAVVVQGWSEADTREDGRDAITISAVDYRWLFSRVEAVVHTGGAGTSALALLTGTPSVTIPFGGDQRFWAWRLRDIGVGANPINRREFTIQALADRIRTITTEPAFKQRATRLSSALKDENGVQTACDLLLSYLSGLRTTGLSPTYPRNS